MRFGPVRGRYQLLCRHRTPKRRSKLPKARFPLVMKTRERDGNDDERCGVDAHGERRLRRGPKKQSTFLSYSVFLMYEWARHHGGFRTPLTRTIHARGYVARSCKICSGGRKEQRPRQTKDRSPLSISSPPPRRDHRRTLLSEPTQDPCRIQGDIGNLGVGQWEGRKRKTNT